MGATSGSFAASAITDNGTSLISTEPLQLPYTLATGTLGTLIPSSTAVDIAIIGSLQVGRMVMTGANTVTFPTLDIVSVNSDASGSKHWLTVDATNANLQGSTNTLVNNLSASSGVFTTSLTVGGNNVCQSTGTNCPASGTVTHTAGALTLNHLMLGNGTADTKVDSVAITDGAGNLTVNSLISNGTGVNSVQIGTNVFSALPTCNSTTEGTTAPVTDSSTVTWGATITGGSTNHVLAYCDGSAWTVMAK